MSREILQPPMQRMGPKRCYRVNLVHEDFGGNEAKKRSPGSSTKQEYLEQDLYDEDDDDDGTYSVEELPNCFRLVMHVAPAFYGGLIGFKGSTKRRIETETQTDIYIPRIKEAGGKTEDITIKGKLRSNVCAARRKIILLIASLRKRMKPTHFLAVILSNEEIKKNFNEFKKLVLSEQLPGIDEQLFQIEGCLHLTVSTCVLLDDGERAKGVEALQKCREFLVDFKTPFLVKVSGLEIMNDDPSAVRILYARIEAKDLQQFANHACAHFLATGLSNEDRENVKMHMTVLSNRYRKQLNPQCPDNFDAREILKRYGDFYFGTAYCDKILLCVMSSKTGVRDDFYKVTGALEF